MGLSQEHGENTEVYFTELKSARKWCVVSDFNL